MKNKFFVMIFLIFCFLVFSGNFLMAQEDEPPEEEEEEPVQARPRPWITLKSDRSLTKLRIIKLRNGRFSVDMRGIKAILEKAKINERVTIILQTKNGLNIANLGSYTPGRRRFLRRSRFTSIPRGFEDPLTALGPYFKNNSFKRTKFRLVFKNSRGSIMAFKSLHIDPDPVDK